MRKQNQTCLYILSSLQHLNVSGVLSQGTWVKNNKATQNRSVHLRTTTYQNHNLKIHSRGTTHAPSLPSSWSSLKKCPSPLCKVLYVIEAFSHSSSIKCFSLQSTSTFTILLRVFNSSSCDACRANILQIMEQRLRSVMVTGY